MITVALPFIVIRRNVSLDSGLHSRVYTFVVEVQDERWTANWRSSEVFRDHKLVYRLDASGQEKAREFAGQKVKVTGQVTGKAIKVAAIEAAS
jgi:hypothetical protein